jgi:6,7-dimethyl-8-ribityllumazine synthase
MATANKNLSQYNKAEIPNAKSLRFGIVVSEWNEQITEGLYKGAYEALLDCGALEADIIRWNVPGSFELTYGCKKMIEVEKPDAIIAIGSVIQGKQNILILYVVLLHKE